MTNRQKTLPYRLLWFLLATASAVALTDSLLEAERYGVTFLTASLLFFFAWIAVAIYSRHSPPLRGRYASAGMALIVLVELIFVSEIKFTYFPAPRTTAEKQFAALNLAVRAGNVDAVNAILARGVNPDFVPGCDATNLSDGCGDDRLLVVAVREGNLPIARTLIEHGATVFVEYQSLVSDAARRNDFPMVRELVLDGARVNDEFEYCPPLEYAIENNNTEEVDFLLAHKAYANAQTGGFTLLQRARATGNREIVRMLKKTGAKDIVRDTSPAVDAGRR